MKNPFSYGPYCVVEDLDCHSAWFVAGCCHTSPFVKETDLEQVDDPEDCRYSVYVIAPLWSIPFLKRRILNRRKLIGETISQSYDE